MDCTLIREELFAYHFGACTDEERDRIDEHLVACAECLRTYLALKRHIQAGASERPSDATVNRLRASVENKFRPKRRAKVIAIFRRKMPVYQSIVAVAIAACVTLAMPSALRAVKAASTTHADTNGEEPRVDSARHAAESLSIF